MRKFTAVAALVVAFMSFAAHAQGERIWRPGGPDPMRSRDPEAVAAYVCSQHQGPKPPYWYSAEYGLNVNGQFMCKFFNPQLFGVPGGGIDRLQFTIAASTNTCPTGSTLVGGFCVTYTDPSKGPCPCGQGAANPINTGTGNKYQQEYDYAGRGPFPLRFQRTYNSQPSLRRSGPMGVGWRHNYELNLRSGDGGNLAVTTTNIIAVRADGTALGFFKITGGWRADPDVTLKLATLASGYTLTDSADTAETYDATGRLLSIERRDGRIQTLAYDASGRVASVVDAYGRSLAFSYDAAGRMIDIQDPAGEHIQFTYEPKLERLDRVRYQDGAERAYHYEVAGRPLLLTGITDELATRFATWGYDAQDRSISSEHAGGVERHTLSYAADGSTTVSTPSGSSHRFAYDNIVAVRRSLGHDGGPCPTCGADFTAMSFDANGFVSSKTDLGGTTTTFIHDVRGLETSRTEAFGTAQARTITTQWHATLRLPTRVTEPGRETTFAYDGTGNRLSMTVRDTATNATRTTAWTYNAVGQVLTVDGARTDASDVTTYAYDAQGNLSSVTNALGQTTAITDHDAHGNPTQMVDANGVVTTMAYDLRQRLLTRTVAGATTAFDYDAAGQLTKVTQPDGAFLTYGYDGAHRLVEVEDGLGNRLSYTLDAAGNRIAEQVFDPYGALARSRARDFDALNHLIRDEDGTGRGTGFAYDFEGKRTSTADDLGRSAGFAYDALDRLTQTTDAANGLTRYAYDARGNLVQVIDPRGVTTGYAYDGFDAVTSTLSPDAGTTTYAYDSAGNRHQQTDARGISATFEYDALNRLTAVHYPDASEDVVYGYDEGENGVGRLTSITDPSGQTRYSYDAHGNVVEDARVIGTTALTTRYAYDAADRLIAMTYPSGRTVTYSRDAAGRISDVRLAGLGGRDLATSLLHEPFGPVAGLVFGNGLVLSRQFDLGGRLTAQQAGTVQQLGWQYDAAGNIIGLSDGAHPERAQSFGYDALDRLTAATGAYGSQSFQYDGVGNRTSLTDDGATTSYGYDAASNRLLTVGSTAYQYDAAGNTTFDGSTHFAFNQANRLNAVTRDGAQLASYVYNALGQRVRKAAGTQGPDYAALAAAAQAEADAHSTNANALTAQADALRDDAAGQEQVAAQQRAAQDAFLATAAAQYALEAEYRADTTAADLRAEAATTHSAALAAEMNAVTAEAAAIAATQAAVTLDAAAAGLQSQSEAAAEQADALELQAAQFQTDASAQEALALDLRDAESAARVEAEAQLALEARLRGTVAALLAQVQGSLDKAAWFRSRKIYPIKKPTDAQFNENMERQAQHFETQVSSTTDAVNALLAEAAAAHAAALTAQAQADQYAEQSIDATEAAVALHAQAEAAAADAATLDAQADTLLAQAEIVRIEAGVQEALAIEQSEAQTAYLAQAQGLYADEQQLLADAEAADLTDEADAAHAAALAAESSASQAEQLSIAATQAALALGAQAASIEAQAAGETQLAQAAQAQADYYADLAEHPPSTFEQTLFAYDLSGHLIGEYALDGRLKVEYAWLEDMPLAQLRPASGPLGGTTVYWYQADHLNTPTQLTDEAKQVVWDAVREPFGKTEIVTSASTITNNLRFPGQFEDSETGLHYNYFRDYDPGTGRYVEGDPIGLRGGMNTYAYVSNHPYNSADTFGLSEWGSDVRAVGYWSTARAYMDSGTAIDAARASGLPGPHNGPADAFRHCVWSCLMTQHLGSEEAHTIGDIHEREGSANGQPNEEEQMDQANNAAGRECGNTAGDAPCADRCMDRYMKGGLFGMGGRPMPAPQSAPPRR